MPSDTLDPGTVIGSRFQIEALLGNGGLGDLYLSIDRETTDPVALRVLPSEICRSEVAIDQMRRQIRQSAKLAHKNVARLFGMGKHASSRYIASEYVEGHSLRQMIDRKKRSGQVFSVKAAYNVIAHVCNALRSALQLNLDPPLFHGLPAPGAIRISRTGRVKLCEFGLIRALPSGAPIIDRLGDSAYLAPEMRMAPGSAPSTVDIYTLGLLLHQLLTGELPQDSQDGHASSRLLPAAARDVVFRCLQTDPTLRYADPEQLKTALYEAVQQEAAAAQEPAQAAERQLQPRGHSAAPTQTTGPAQALPASHPAPSVAPAPVAPAPVAPARAPAPIGSPQDVPALSAPAQPPIHAIAPSPTASPFGTIPSPKAQLDQLLAAPPPDNSDNWLVRKGGSDFGPFTLTDIKHELYRGEFEVEHDLVDRDTAAAIPLRRHPHLAPFIRALEQFRQAEHTAHTELAALQHSKKRRAVVLTSLAVSVTVLAITGAVVFFMFRNPKVVVREVQGKPQQARLKLDITWKNEPPEQAAKRKAMRKKRRRRATARKGSPDDEVTYLGDASKGGKDQLLSQQQIQSVMERNVPKLGRCVLAQARRDPTLRRAAIDFGVRGSGSVSYVKVNGSREGPFHACVARVMTTVQFPKYDGVMTRASFAMSIQR